MILPKFFVWVLRAIYTGRWIIIRESEDIFINTHQKKRVRSNYWGDAGIGERIRRDMHFFDEKNDI